MIPRILSILVVLFWLVMMGLLVQRSFFPEHTVLAEVPYPVVLRAVLTSDEQPTLVIRDTTRRGADGLGEELGRCHLTIQRVRLLPPLPTGAEGSQKGGRWEILREEWAGTAESRTAHYYYLRNDLAFEVEMQTPMRLDIRTHCYFDPQFRLAEFDSSMLLRSRGGPVGGAFQALRVRGDKESGKVYVQSGVPGLMDVPPLPFARFEQASLGRVLGLTELPGVAALSGLSAMARAGQKGQAQEGRVVCREELVKVGGGQVRSYVVENLYGENVKLLIYVTRDGQIWRVETPFGILLESENPPLLQ